MLHRWAHGPAVEGVLPSIPDLFGEQVSRRPDAIAVVQSDRRLTYRELEERSRRVAVSLMRRGLRAGDRVGICSGRQVDLISGILGILRGGGVYVPIPADLPSERQQFLVQDSGIRIILAERGCQSMRAAGAVTVCSLEEVASADDPATELNDLPRIDPDAVACVMYTSGSTGRPKGVCVGHESIVRLVHQADYARFGSDRVFLHLSPLEFDASTFEIWGALLNGGRVVLAPSGPPDLGTLGSLIRSEGVTTLWLTSSLFNQVVEDAPDMLSGPEEILVGGEALSVRHIQKAQQLLGDSVRLINGYGPTESTTFTTCYTIPPGVDTSWSSIPIGRPISGRSVYVLDEALQPVPVGVPGELYIGGRGLAQGYLNRPELTSEKFIADPFSGRPGDRLYRSGDLCRWREDGVLEFLGRRDQQVKLRGHRIELEEIEAAALDAPEVAQCVVIVREFGDNDHRLVAFVVAKSGKHLVEDRLLALLRRRLPDYMVPSLVVVLPSLPLTPSGKICRRSLQALDLRRPPRQEHDSAEPRNQTERRLLDLWEELLGRKVPGIHANFFALGGHSLLAIRLCSRIASRLGVQLRISEVFEYPTIMELGSRIDSCTVETPTRRVSLKSADRNSNSRIPLSFAQQRLWIIDQLHQGSAHYHICLAWRINGALDRAALQRALDNLVKRQKILRTCFRSDDDGVWQEVQPHQPANYRFVDLFVGEQSVSDATANVLRKELEAKAFDLSGDQMLRALLLRTGEDDYLFEICVHHIACDGLSLSVLTGELAAEYEAESRRLNSNIPPLPIQYADFAVWQRNELTAERQAELAAYWKTQLRGMTPGVFPTDSPRPKGTSFHAAELPIRLDGSLVQQLESLGRKNGATLHMMLLAALQLLIARFSGQADISIGSPIASRDIAELERLIGFLVNLVVVRCRLPIEQTFENLLAEVRAQCIAAYDHSDLPFDLLVQELPPEDRSLETPLVQTVFQLLPGPINRLDLPGLAVEPIPQFDVKTRFDMEFSLWPEANELAGVIVYNIDLYRPETVQRIASAFERLLREIAANPELRLCEQRLQRIAEREEALHEGARSPALDEMAVSPTGNNSATPLTETERRMLALWEELLGRSVPGIHANFFHLGGHSLLAMRMVRRIRSEFGREVPVSKVFSQPSVAQLAALVQTNGEEADQTVVPKVNDRPSQLRVIREGAGEVAIIIMGLPAGSFLRECPSDYGLWFYENPMQAERGILDSAEDLRQEISSTIPCRRVVLVGFSYAALVAHATAILLTESGKSNTQLVLVEPSMRVRWSDQLQKLRESRVRELPIRAFRSVLHRIRKRARRLVYRRKLRRGMAVAGTEQYECQEAPKLMANIQHHQPALLTGDAILVCGSSYERWRIEAWKQFLTGTMSIHLLPEATHHNFFRDSSLQHKWIRLFCVEPAA